MSRPRLLLVSLVCLALAGLSACAILASEPVAPVGCDQAMPQFAPGTDPLCYGSLGCPVLVMASPLPQEELNALAAAAWTFMRWKYLTGAITDQRCSECVPIRWEQPPTISVCWSSFNVEHPACFGDEVNVCTGKASWVTARPYQPATWRVAIRTDVDAATQRVLVVDGVVNLALMLTGNDGLYNGTTGADVKARLFGK